jgi:hypothetical protein
METMERRYTTTDKSEWGPGEWQDEPDKVQWVDEATGLDCLIVRGPGGALCGYVGITEGHPWFGIDYSGCTLPEPCGEPYCSHYPDVDVHGGLTFADFCHEGPDPSRGICHVPFEGRPERVWWFGFDCAHSGDVTPKWSREWGEWGASYKTERYVRGWCANLASQLAARATPTESED